MERHLLQVLQWAGLDLEEEDSWVWKVGELQTYSANSIYVLLRLDREKELYFVYCKLWRCKALPSALFTDWKVLENKITTTVNLEMQEL